MHHIYCISVHLSWNFSSNVLENFQWVVSKPYIWICFPRRFVEGRGEGAGFGDFTYQHQHIDLLQVNHYKLFKFAVFEVSVSPSVTKALGLIPHNYLESVINIFNKKTCSSPRCPLRSHSLVRIKNHLFIVVLEPILNKKLGFIFRSDCSDCTCVYS